MRGRIGANRRRAGRVWATLALVLVLAGAGTASWLRPWETLTAEPLAEPVTAAVENTTLTSQVRLNAQLSYGDPEPLPAVDGTVTALPTVGATVQIGHQVYETDGRPVVLFRGARPFWRELTVDSADGEDVRQLQQNLADLGFDPGSVDGDFGRQTRVAVRAWQKSLGVEVTGVFSPSDVVVADAPSIRIAQITSRLGDVGASPATYTETILRATARLSPAQARELTVGTPVTMTLPDGTEVETALAAVDPGGQPTGEGAEVTAPTAIIEFADQEQAAAAGLVTVRVVVRAEDTQPATLVVPVTALLATPDGGYAVEAWDGERVARTTVEIGLVADARAQVLRSGTEVDGGTGAALRAGDLVVLAR